MKYVVRRDFSIVCTYVRFSTGSSAVPTVPLFMCSFLRGVRPPGGFFTHSCVFSPPGSAPVTAIFFTLSLYTFLRYAHLRRGFFKGQKPGSGAARFLTPYTPLPWLVERGGSSAWLNCRVERDSYRNGVRWKAQATRLCVSHESPTRSPTWGCADAQVCAG